MVLVRVIFGGQVSLPFVVTVWMSSGTVSLFDRFSTLMRCLMSWPSMGPMYLKPSASKNWPSTNRDFTMSLSFSRKLNSGMPTLGIFSSHRRMPRLKPR